MKKILILFTFMSFVSFAVNAQTCSHAKKSSSTAATTETSSEYGKMVANAAAMDETIEQRVCAKSGTVSYAKKNVCEVSGKVSYTDVEYDAATKKFVNVSPSDTEAKKKACCAGGGTKACCAGGSAKSCTKSKSSGASSSVSPAPAKKVKMVKSEN